MFRETGTMSAIGVGAGAGAGVAGGSPASNSGEAARPKKSAATTSKLVRRRLEEHVRALGSLMAASKAKDYASGTQRTTDRKYCSSTTKVVEKSVSG